MTTVPAHAVCPACGRAAGRPVLRLDDVPVTGARLHATRAAAEARRGGIDLRVCAGCGLTWNAAFDPGLLGDRDGEGPAHPGPPGSGERTLTWLAETPGLGDRLAVSLDAADIPLLARLCARTGARALVVDARWAGPGHPAAGVEVSRDDRERLREVPRLILLRDRLERTGEPRALLGRVRAMTGSGTAVRVEVADVTTPDPRSPDPGSAAWRLAYARPLRFTPTSLSLALRRSGLAVSRLERDGGDGLLRVEGGRAAVPPGPAGRPGDDVAAARRLAARTRRLLDDWRTGLEALLGRGHRVALWGTGPEALGLLALVPASRDLALLVDPDPDRQGRFAPRGVGPVRPPVALRRSAVDLVLVSDDRQLTAAHGLLRSLELPGECRRLRALGTPALRPPRTRRDDSLVS